MPEALYCLNFFDFLSILFHSDTYNFSFNLTLLVTLHLIRYVDYIITIMAVTFAISSLISLGLSTSDIAIIYGAARKAGTWVKAQWNDQQLLGFLQVETDDIMKRRGLIDVNRLNERWGKTLTIMSDGRKRSTRVPIEAPSYRITIASRGS